MSNLKDNWTTTVLNDKDDTSMVEDNLPAVFYDIDDFRLELRGIDNEVPKVDNLTTFLYEIDYTSLELREIPTANNEILELKDNLTAGFYDIDDVKLQLREIPKLCYNEIPKKDNLPAISYYIEDFSSEQQEMPKIGDNDVLLQMECVGICESDMSFFKGINKGVFDDYKLLLKSIIGHEASGTVVKVGSSVMHLEEGNRVAIEPGVPCRVCSFCKEDRYNLCPKMTIFGTFPNDGNPNRFYAHAADFCHKLPPNVSLEEGALLEPLSLAVHACQRAGIAFGSTVLILGARLKSLFIILAAKAMGASKIMVTDSNQHRLDVAKSLGADIVFQIIPNDCDVTIAIVVRKLMGCSPSASIVCSGADQNVRVAIRVTKSGGVVVLVAKGNPTVKIPLVSAIAREVEIRGCYRSGNNYSTTLEMVAFGKLKVKQLITHHFPMEDFKEAFNVAENGKENAIKVIFHVNPNWEPE